MVELVSDKSKLLIQIMLTDAKVRERVFESIKDHDKYKICTIHDDGTVVMGKTSIEWWNKLLNCQTTIPFESFALKIWDALVDLSSGLNNKAIMEGLSREVVMNSVRKTNYDWVVDRLFDCWKHVAQKSEGYKTSFSPEGEQVIENRDGSPIINLGDRKIIISINGEEKVLPIIDSIGDPLHLGLKFGITGVTRIGQRARSQCSSAEQNYINSVIIAILSLP